MSVIGSIRSVLWHQMGSWVSSVHALNYPMWSITLFFLSVSTPEVICVVVSGNVFRTGSCVMLQSWCDQLHFLRFSFLQFDWLRCLVVNDNFTLVHLITRFEVFYPNCRSELHRLVCLLGGMRWILIERRLFMMMTIVLWVGWRCAYMNIGLKLEKWWVVTFLLIDLSDWFFIHRNV